MVDQAVRHIDPERLRAFRTTFEGEVVLPGAETYDAGRAVWNGMIDRRPAIILRPTDAAEVAAALRFARDEDLVVAVRSGGHSLAGYSTCDDGAIIDLAAMRGVTVDPERRIARCNGGALLGELDDAAQAFGLACNSGTVSHTGVAGLTLGGGMGRLQRKLGLSIDCLRAVELVTADGRHVRASADEHPDLFWGLRGAGANFGIATALEFDLQPIGPMITRGFLVFPAARAREVCAAFRDYLPTAPDDLMASVVITPGPARRGVPARGRGPADRRARGRLRRARGGRRPGARAAPGPRARGHGRDPPPDASRVAACERRRDGLGPPRLHEERVPRQPARSARGRIRRARGRNPPGEDSFSIWAFGGAVGRVPEDATAFPARSAPFWVGAESMWDDAADDAAHVAWGRAGIDLIEPYRVTGQYVNDVSEAGDEALVRGVYGDAKYDRLVALKRAWDPDNVFRLNQNIRP